MALSDLVSEVRGREKTLVVSGPPETARVAAELRSHFAMENVAVEFEEGEKPLSVRLRDGDGVLVELEGESARSVTESTSDDGLRAHLDEQTFTSYESDEMLAATREIEDRAWRVGAGALHAGFQFFSAFEEQVEVYRRLASVDLDVHVYAAPDVSPPEGPFETYRIGNPALTSIWFVAFDGDGDPEQKCALVAEERTPDSYYGFLTYDPDLVDEVLAELPAEDRTSA
ncbi:MAG: DICT sensory domain-containing protein [Halobacteriaceae archaeon]